MGRLLEYVVAHEVGHTLGFQHNMKASSQYPIDSVRNADFVRRMGHTPTLMDYSRFNYVAQPEDKIQCELLVPQHRPVRHLGDALGLRAGECADAGGAAEQHAHRRRVDARRRSGEDDARQLGARAGREAVAALLDVGRVRLRSGRRDGSGRRHRPREGDRARIQESQTQHAVDSVGDGEADRGLRCDGRALQPTDRTVPHGTGACRESRRRNELAGEVRRSAGTAVHARSKEPTRASDEIHRRQRIPDADVADRHGHSAQARAERRSHAHRQRAVGDHCAICSTTAR